MVSSNHLEILPSGLSFKMIYVEGGSFIMGGTDEEAEDREKPIHKVSLGSFYLGQYPVTQALWEIVMKTNPSEFEGETNPVETVSWEDSQIFLQKLNQLTGKSYRLPTEAEWEFAARGGIQSEGYLYSGSDKLKEAGWYGGNSNGQTQPVGQKLSNELGLFDMSGNVYEWCQDWYGENYYQHCADQELVKNPQGPEK
ncbi:MAG: SUMF1/EgtB/PvdO family nonheme iron enzyme, partial [Bacteroidetes bacterium]|nr:SUMF1/EgtB/PvdO family nonheme iron enzyme [Bacteroidota bacterium]